MTALREMEEMVLGSDGLDGLVLRYGFFYGPGTYYAEDGTSTEDVRRRRLPIVGKGSGRVLVHPRGRRRRRHGGGGRARGAGVYNVTDDEPAPMGEWVPVSRRGRRREAATRACRSGWRGLVAGKDVSNFAASLRGASNEKAKRELGWRPAHPSWRSGFAESLAR